MTHDKAIDKNLSEAVELYLARDTHGEGIEKELVAVLRAILLDQIVSGDNAAAAETAERLAMLPDQPDAVELVIEIALEAGATQAARSALSEAEATGRLQRWRAAYLKARIALESGDLLAARAILVTAIDAAPDNAALRALLAEAMVAAGTASDARAVLGHIGRPPVNPRPERSDPDDGDAPAAVAGRGASDVGPG